MPKWLVSFLLLVGAFVGAAQTASELDAPAVQRVAKKLLCSCGCQLEVMLVNFCKLEWIR